VRRFARLTLDAKLILMTSAALWLAGGIGFFTLEVSNSRTLGALSLPQALVQAWFFTVTPRTAGFATLNVGDFRVETLFLLTGLMFIGGAPGSTAGGIKVTSLALLVVAVISAAKGRMHVVAFEREIPLTVVLRALTAATLAMVIVLNAALVLTVTGTFPFIDIVFEATSAFSTTGLSTGITPEQSTSGRLVLIATMIVGRLGPLTLAYALARRAEPPRLRYGEESVRVG
jgi:trk system potassium uptake protein TrkH